MDCVCWLFLLQEDIVDVRPTKKTFKCKCLFYFTYIFMCQRTNSAGQKCVYWTQCLLLAQSNRLLSDSSSTLQLCFFTLCFLAVSKSAIAISFGLVITCPIIHSVRICTVVFRKAGAQLLPGVYTPHFNYLHIQLFQDA